MNSAVWHACTALFLVLYSYISLSLNICILVLFFILFIATSLARLAPSSIPESFFFSCCPQICFLLFLFHFLIYFPSFVKPNAEEKKVNFYKIACHCLHSHNHFEAHCTFIESNSEVLNVIARVQSAVCRKNGLMPSMPPQTFSVQLNEN